MVGAGLAGLGLFFAIGVALVFVLVVIGLAAVMGGATSGFGGIVAFLLLACLAALIGLPLATLATS